MKELRLYKVECIDGVDDLFLDEKGNPYLVNPKAIFYGGKKTKEKMLCFTSKKYYKSVKGTTRYLKNIIATTLLGNKDKFVWYKDDNPKNCTTDNLMLVDERFWQERTATEENSFICKRCGKRTFNKLDNKKDKLCGKCKRKNKADEKKEIIKDKYKKLGKYIDDNKDYIRMTELRKNIIPRLKEGKGYSQIARELNVTRQCIEISVRKALERIKVKQEWLKK